MDMPMDMQHQVMGYDRAATMFSPEGHLLQVEYGEKAVRLGSASIGMVCTDGVFILADRRMKDKLINSKSSGKIHEVDEHVIASVAGIGADARILIEKAQVICQQHRVTYDSPIEPELVVKEIANVKQQFTQYGGARPFGVSMMFAGIDGKKPELYTTDVTGNYIAYNANAIGEDDEKIREKLRDDYKKDLTIKQGVKLAIKILEEVRGKEFNLDKLELCYIETKDNKMKRIEGRGVSEL